MVAKIIFGQKQWDRYIIDAFVFSSNAAETLSTCRRLVRANICNFETWVSFDKKRSDCIAFVGILVRLNNTMNILART